eukprot:CAMPEP_0178425526 /NCGR_PEP_ID=MMETSP0689_2-20121128/28768_1 /TAXON_ID=160604 /ORGANISM="Amphidinium massartii, Strain CS-259" /LENGTH=162 /DNA_ID=CAMNT_0020047191 /DNA_START=57 /DNA_END=542 /DNA_ORIENTATION=-
MAEASSAHLVPKEVDSEVESGDEEEEDNPFLSYNKAVLSKHLPGPDGKPKCLIFGCDKPTWNGEPMEFCSRQCKEEWWLRGQPPFGPPPPEPPLPPVPRPSLSCAQGIYIAEPEWDQEEWEEQQLLKLKDKEKGESETIVQMYWILGTFLVLATGWFFAPHG